MYRILLATMLALMWTLHACAAQDITANPRGELTHLLPEIGAPLVGGTLTKVSVRIVLHSHAPEAIKYKARLIVNGRSYGPFVITMLPGASGTAIATWYVCVTVPSFATHVQLTGRGSSSGSEYNFGELSHAFPVRIVLARSCTRTRFFQRRHRCY
jgi:hypothetical protein